MSEKFTRKILLSCLKSFQRSHLNNEMELIVSDKEMKISEIKEEMVDQRSG